MTKNLLICFSLVCCYILLFIFWRVLNDVGCWITGVIGMVVLISPVGLLLISLVELCCGFHLLSYRWSHLLNFVNLSYWFLWYHLLGCSWFHFTSFSVINNQIPILPLKFTSLSDKKIGLANAYMTWFLIWISLVVILYLGLLHPVQDRKFVFLRLDRSVFQQYEPHYFRT